MTPPADVPVLLWDGECGFCRYWVIRWKIKTGDRIRYATYQEAGQMYPGISENEFRKAAFLIEPDGNAYRGAAAGLRALTYGRGGSRWFRWYKNYVWFRVMADKTYGWIARHRPILWKITISLWGKYPAKPKPVWVLWLSVIVLAAAIFVATIN